MRAPHKEVQRLVNEARKAGATVTRPNGGHLLVLFHGHRVRISSTPTGRSLKNDRARLRRKGLDL